MHNDPTQPHRVPPPPPKQIYRLPPPYRPTLADHWRWYSGQHIIAKIFWAAVALFAFCFIGSAVVAGTIEGITGTSIYATPTPHNLAQAAQTTPTKVKPTPTPSPTPSPTPKPSPTPTPKPKPTEPPPPKPTEPPAIVGENGNPWGYNFEPGALIYSPNPGFCGYFSCIASFWDGQGYVMECADSTYGKSGGLRGSCSHHGGNWRALYSH